MRAFERILAPNVNAWIYSPQFFSTFYLIEKYRNPRKPSTTAPFKEFQQNQQIAKN